MYYTRRNHNFLHRSSSMISFLSPRRRFRKCDFMQTLGFSMHMCSHNSQLIIIYHYKMDLTKEAIDRRSCGRTNLSAHIVSVSKGNAAHLFLNLRFIIVHFIGLRIYGYLRYYY